MYRRTLGKLSASQLAKRRKFNVKDAEAYIYETKLEEVLEREFVIDPTLVTEIILADEYWRKRSTEIKAADPRDPNREFTDIHEGQAWQDHEFLGNPVGGCCTRMAFEGYMDEVEVPNGIGVARGHSQLCIFFLVLLNRPPGSRMTLRSINLAAVCLAKDFKDFGPQLIISDPEGDMHSCSIGATMRRFHEGVTLKTPSSCGFPSMPVRGWMPIFTADGKAQGQVFGTNASFSACKNPCNTCEDLDQSDPRCRVPCSFLKCLCGDADTHQMDCPCHFRLRTPARDRTRPLHTLSSAQRQLMGITTLNHGFTHVPGFCVARPCPKEGMHALAEGRTAHLAAYTIWFVWYSKLATSAEIRLAAHNFDWTPGGGSSGFFSPTYLPDTFFTSTKVYQPDGSWVWGPHKDMKLPFSAAGTFTFTAMSIPFFSKWIPHTAWPLWFKVWVLHAHGVLMTLRYSFTYVDLLKLEALFIESERAILTIPQYASIWVPKAHWILHIAHDIYLWGPSRLLMTFLKEMKLAHFKRGCKRSNFHNPVKSTAEFWALQSDYQALQVLKYPNLRQAATSENSRVIVSGTIHAFPDSEVCRSLLSAGWASATNQISFLESLEFCGVPICQGEHVIYNRQVYHVSRIAKVRDFHYMLLELIAREIQMHESGMMSIEPLDHGESRLITLFNSSDLTGIWVIRAWEAFMVVVKY